MAPGFPDRTLPKGPKAEIELKKRTLTNLYNQHPTWLENAHRDLDKAVAAAYGWPEDISTEDALARLLALNHARAKAKGAVAVAPRSEVDEASGRTRGVMINLLKYNTIRLFLVDGQPSGILTAEIMK